MFYHSVLSLFYIPCKLDCYFSDEVEESKTFKPTEEEPEVCDARGRPLFGLKALQTGGDYETMPEQKTSQQLKELVEKHEKNAR